MGSIYGARAVSKRYIPAHKQHEQSLQKQVCHYLRLQYPRVIFRSDFASGLHLTRNQAVTHRNLQSGRAWPDMFIYQPMQHGDKLYFGLALELKKDGTSIYRKDGKLVADLHIQEQAAILGQLNGLGYFARFAVGIDNAIKIIDWYFKKPQNEELF